MAMLRRLARGGGIALLALACRGSVEGAPSTTNTHWAFQPVQDSPVPAVRNTRWPRNEVDRFILAKLEAHGLTPSAAADRRTLIRRATFDLIGLPPTPAEVEAFTRDRSPDAFGKVVERLLASAQYGERWGRHWLDVARYADTAGDSGDFPVPQAWRYRNYVIDAFNRDKPYDEFLREQIAGDLLPSADEETRRERIIATGFIASAKRLGANATNAAHLVIEDTLDTMSQAVLGLSLSCARCHDHKYDPISMQDYYALYGIFNSTRYPFTGAEMEPRQKDFVPLVSALETEMLREAHAERLAALDEQIERLEKELEPLRKEGFDVSSLQKNLDEVVRRRGQWAARQPGLESAYAVAEGMPGDARLQKRGEPTTPGEEVPRRFLKILGGQELPKTCAGSGRLELAEWLTDPANPLTARVMVNRVWQHHFGRGLVATPSDFGTRGQPPSHPELLDWLATCFVESGWSIKAMHRLILTSATYGQVSSSEFWASSSANAPTRNPELETRNSLDPDNALLAHFSRQRLDAEQIRDALLFVSGTLDLTPGGAHPFPPEATWKFSQHFPFTAVYETDRRSVYLMQQRIRRHPFFAIFDGADPNVSTAERQTGTTPLQALFAMNDRFAHEQAGEFAARLLREHADDRQRLDLAHQLAFARATRADEIRDGLAWLGRFREKLRAMSVPEADLSLRVWSGYARALLGSNEFLFVD